MPHTPDARYGAATPAMIAVRVKPGAARTRVGGRYDGRLGPALVVAVNAPAVDGQANEATRRALASALGIKPNTLVLRTGATSRDKLFAVDDPPSDLANRVAELRDHLTWIERVLT